MGQVTHTNVPGTLTGTMTPSSSGPVPSDPLLGGGSLFGLNAADLGQALMRSIALRQAMGLEQYTAMQEQRQQANTDRREAKTAAARKETSRPISRSAPDPYATKRRAYFQAANSFAATPQAPGSDLGVRGAGREPLGAYGLRAAGNFMGMDAGQGLTSSDLQAAMLAAASGGYR
jgi:hypothetical protein